MTDNEWLDTDLDDLTQEIVRVSRIRGTFELSSGKISDEYYDKWQLMANPKLLRRIAKYMAVLVPVDTQVLVGLELGGIPLVTAICLETGMPMAIVRKTKKTYGTAKQIEGTPVQGKRVTLVEDIITTGSQAAKGAEIIRREEGIVHDLICVIKRSEFEGTTFHGMIVRNMLELGYNVSGSK